jgi:hypothetical protein
LAKNAPYTEGKFGKIYWLEEALVDQSKTLDIKHPHKCKYKEKDKL